MIFKIFMTTLNSLYLIGVFVLKQIEYISADAYLICTVLLIINITLINKGE